MRHLAGPAAHRSPRAALGRAPAGAAHPPPAQDFTLPAPGKPRSITVGPDKALWFTSDFEGNRVGRITTKGR